MFPLFSSVPLQVFRMEAASDQRSIVFTRKGHGGTGEAGHSSIDRCRGSLRLRMGLFGNYEHTCNHVFSACGNEFFTKVRLSPAE